VPVDLKDALARLGAADLAAREGRLVAARGLTLRATLPGARVGDAVEIDRGAGPPLAAEVLGFDGPEALLLPLGEPTGLAPGDPVRPAPGGHTVPASPALKGRVLDARGRALDGGPEPEGEPWPIDRPAPAPLSRARITEPFLTGIRAIDGLATLGVGQRVGLFAGSGVGKSTLLGRIARHGEADTVVIGLVGERGREVREFVEDALGPEGLARSVVVCATSDRPALVRLRAAEVATALAEYFRDRGERVLLLVDSLTRYVRAAREIGLAAGEPPTRRGFPPSAFARLPRLLERAGPGAAGTITAVYSVLVEGDDTEEPVADEVRGLLDGHLVLDRALFHRGRRPALDPVRSLSRLMDRVTSESHRLAARSVRADLALYEAKRDLVLLGAYERGQDARLDGALSRLEAIETLLRQPDPTKCPIKDTLAALKAAAMPTS
jgi:type III secretion protein N (ATPase)